MKTIFWNIGLIIIRFGYRVRKYSHRPIGLRLRWRLGVAILAIGFSIRGNGAIYRKTWRWNNKLIGGGK